MLHNLKTLPKYFVRIFSGEKTFEVRKNDRDFNSGDILNLEEWDDEKNEYTGRRLLVTVFYILYGGQFGMEEGTCVMSIKISSIF